MFNEENDENNWWDEESEIDKIKKEYVLKIEREKKEYIRYQTLYDYVKTSTGMALLYFYYEDKAVETLKKMLKMYLLREEYEKCADIRDWLEDVNEYIQNNEGYKDYNKDEKTCETRITF